MFRLRLSFLGFFEDLLVVLEGLGDKGRVQQIPTIRLSGFCVGGGVLRRWSGGSLE